jgi:hypothetical protein
MVFENIAAEKWLLARPPIIPAGLRYRESQPCIAELNFGALQWLKDFPCRNLLIGNLEEQIATLPVYRRRNEAADHELSWAANARRARGLLIHLTIIGQGIQGFELKFSVLVLD